MFARRTYQSDSFSKHRAGKATSKPKRSFRDHAVAARKATEKSKKVDSPPAGSTLTSPIITLCVGPEQRLFAAHEDVLSTSPFFAAMCRGQFLESATKRVNLPEELPEVFSSVLEYLYKGDYYPRLLHNKRRNAWELEDSADNNGGRGVPESTVFHGQAQQFLLKDTLLYCAAERYGLDELKRLRAHYLALIIRSRSTFKRSGTMQMEMEAGGRLFFDLFVAMCNHMDDITSVTKSPR